MTIRRMRPSCPLWLLAARTPTGQFLPPPRGTDASGREAERDHVAVLDEVVAALDPELGSLASLVVAARLHQLLPGHDLGGHEAALHVRVHGAGGPAGRGAAGDRPRVGLGV